MTRVVAGLIALSAAAFGTSTSLGATAASKVRPPAPAAAAPATAAPPALAADDTPRPGRVRTFGDWALGCDNQLACSAVSLLPETATEPYPVLLTIQLDAGAGASPVLRLSAFDQLRGKVDLRVDGAIVATLVAARDAAELSGAPALRAIRALAAGYALEFRQKRIVAGRVSLAGLRDALAALDAQQGRTGTATALVAAGTAGMSRLRTAPSVPVITRPASPPRAETAPGLTATEETEARRLAVCDGRIDPAYPVESHDLGAGQVLVLLPCNAAAYNVSVVPLLAQGAPGARTLRIATFDFVPGATGAPGTPTLLVNPRWNPRTGLLSSFAKGRGLGDCGAAEDYVWDGSRFRLVEARAMPMCRGAWEWPRIWSAETKRG